ncbi:MAG: carbon monoxide dehydrogenase accessory protein CooC [Dehalococcoidia bacterium]|nr:carbon monoxide dehydrogenase accessory protein CooC [Dehalococcoidia bacterium]
MKLAVTGKGGVGKTTVASLLARVYAAEGKNVLAIDANPDPNLATALGIPAEEVQRIVPIAEMKELVEERTGAKPGTMGGVFKMNPRVDDIPEKYAARIDGVRLIVMGTVAKGGGGCICPESVLLRTLVTHLILTRKDVVVMDMDAGVEHLGRGTARGIDAFIAVVEPGQRSVQTALAVKRLAHDLGIEKFYVVGSKVRNEADRKYVQDNMAGSNIIGFLSYHPEIVEADRLGRGVYESAPKAVEEVRKIKEKLDRLYEEAHGGKEVS